MKIIIFLKEILKFLLSIFPLGAKNFLLSLNDLSSSTFFINREERSVEDLEIFVKDDNSLLHLEESYRWSIKKGWMFFPELAVLHKLSQIKVLEKDDLEFFKKCVGNNTLKIHPDEINKKYRKICSNYAEHLVSVKEGDPILIMPTDNENTARINSFYKRYKPIFNMIEKKLNVNFSKNDPILEIGYESGGHSLFALEKLGFNVTGIDNGYSGLRLVSLIPEKIKKSINSNAQFVLGDITKKTSFDSEHFKAINSIAVLEHILDLPSAFQEMYRILKPAGIMLHSYDPFFHPAGGHSLGVLDLPWGHLQLNPDEYKRYIQQFRPLEVSHALNWYNNGVHKKYPKRLMMQLILDSGFEILYWNTRKIDHSQRSRISNDLLANVFKNYPEISEDDLLACEHTFIAQKI